MSGRDPNLAVDGAATNRDMPVCDPAAAVSAVGEKSTMATDSQVLLTAPQALQISSG